jgi:hypothetical protein
MNTITTIYNFYKFLYSQKLFVDQISDSGVWTDVIEEAEIDDNDQKQNSFIRICNNMNTAKFADLHNMFFPLLYSGAMFGEIEYIGYFDGKFINLDEDFEFSNYGKGYFESMKRYDTVEEVWDKIVKPKIMDYLEEIRN